MAITTYAELQTAAANWLNRADLTSRLPEFIALAEADLRRRLRDVKNEAAVTMVVGAITHVITGAKEIESLRYNESSYRFPLRQMSMAGLADVSRSGRGLPVAFALFGGNTLRWDIEPDDTYNLKASYIATLTPLSGGNPTNSTLTSSPDIYLYGTLVQAAPYLEHDERIPLWKQMYEEAVVRENVYREGQEFGAAPEMRLPTVFGDESGW